MVVTESTQEQEPQRFHDLIEQLGMCLCNNCSHFRIQQCVESGCKCCTRTWKSILDK
jgi:hypothetical protein